MSATAPAPLLSPPARRRPGWRLALGAGVAIWAAVVAGATVGMMRYASIPGEGGPPVAEWPAASRLRSGAGQPTLVVFMHPRCPCTRASLGELEALLATAGGRAAVHVVLLKPAGTEPNWEKTALWQRASALPGVNVFIDDDGVEVQRFGATTSGLAVLFGRDGRRQFHGGLTLARGHAGDNPGRRTLAALLQGSPAPRESAPVFGCALCDGQLPAPDSRGASNP